MDETGPETKKPGARRGRGGAAGTGPNVIKPVVVNAKSARTGVTLRKKDFLDRAADRSGIKKTDARSAIEAALAVLSEALVAGDEVILPPLGKLRVMREKDNGKARILTLRLQIMTEGDVGPGAKKEPLADPDD